MSYRDRFLSSLLQPLSLFLLLYDPFHLIIVPFVFCNNKSFCLIAIEGLYFTFLSLQPFKLLSLSDDGQTFTHFFFSFAFIPSLLSLSMSVFIFCPFVCLYLSSMSVLFLLSICLSISLLNVYLV